MCFHRKEERFAISFQVASRFGFDADARKVFRAEDARIELLRLRPSPNRFNLGQIAKRLYSQHTHRFGPKITGKNVAND